MSYADPEKEREAKRRYREANAEKERDRGRRYREMNRDRINEYTRRWREANPGRVREYNQRYSVANREQIREKGRRYYAANREQGRKQQIERTLRQSHGLWPEQRAQLRADQDGRCYLCEEPLPEGDRGTVIDHDHRCCPPSRSCSRCRRGLAHISCNTLVGMAGDDPKRLRRIAANLERAKRQVVKRPQLTLFEVADLGLPDTEGTMTP